MSEAQKDATTELFGTLEQSSRPDLAIAEREYKSQQANGEQPTQAGYTGAPPDPDPPAPDMPSDTPEGPDAPPPPAPEEAPGQGGDPGTAESAAEPEAMPDEAAIDEKTDAILAKYGHNPRELAKAYRNIQGLAGRKDAELQGVKKEWEALQPLVDQYFEIGADGKPRLKIDEAARALGAQRGPKALPEDIPLQAIEEHLREEYRSELTQKGYEQEDINRFLDDMSGRIKREAKGRKDRIEGERQMALDKETEEVRGILQSWEDRNPDHGLEKEQDRFFGSMPPEVVRQMIIRKWGGGYDRIMSLLRLEKNVETMVQTAYREGLKDAGNRVEPSGGAQPSSGGQSQRPRQTGAQTEEEQVTAFKQRVLGTGTKSVMDQLVK